MADYPIFIQAAPTLSQTADSVLGPPPPAPPPAYDGPKIAGKDPNTLTREDLYAIELQRMQQQAGIAGHNAGLQADAARKTARAQQEFLDAPRPEIHKPVYQPMPEPPKPQYREPWQAVGNPLAALALLIGAFGRQSGTAVLNAASSAMEAQKKNDTTAYEHQRELFKDNLQKVIQQNDMERTAYSDSWKDRKMTLDEKLGDLEMKATMYKNTAMANAARSGNVTGISQQLDAWEKAGEHVKSLQTVFSGKTDVVNKVYSDAYNEGVQMQKRGMLPQGQTPLQYAVEKAAPTVAQITAAEKGAAGRPTTPAGQEFAAATDRAHRELGEGRPTEDYTAFARNVLEGEKGFRQLPYEVQNVFKAFPEVAARVKSEPGKVTPQNAAKLTSALRVIKSTDDVGNYIAENPDTVGALAAIENKMRGSMFSLPKIDATSSDAQTAVDQRAAASEKVIRSQIGRVNIPGVGLMTEGLADRAIRLQKMLFQTGLEDAAAMSASGRGGTVYLDQAMSSKVYNQLTNPRTLMDFMRLRANEAQRNWKLIDERIDFGTHGISDNLHSDLLDPVEYPKMMQRVLEKSGNIKAKKPGNVEVPADLPQGTTYFGNGADGRPVFVLPNGNHVSPAR
jgi:hypothetical protein